MREAIGLPGKPTEKPVGDKLMPVRRPDKARFRVSIACVTIFNTLAVGLKRPQPSCSNFIFKD